MSLKFSGSFERRPASRSSKEPSSAIRAETYDSIQKVGQRYFFRKRQPGQEQPCIYFRDGADGRDQLRAGTADIVTVLNTQLTLFQAEDTLWQAQLAQLLAFVSLYQALGGGWEPKMEKPVNAL